MGATYWIDGDIVKAKARSQMRDLIVADCAFSERVSVRNEELNRVSPLQAFLLSVSKFVGGGGSLCQFSRNFYLCKLMCSCGLRSVVRRPVTGPAAPARNADASLTTDGACLTSAISVDFNNWLRKSESAAAARQTDDAVFGQFCRRPRPR